MKQFASKHEVLCKHLEASSEILDASRKQIMSMSEVVQEQVGSKLAQMVSDVSRNNRICMEAVWSMSLAG